MEKVENKLHTQLVMRKPTKGAFDEEKSKINIMEYSTETRVTAESSNTGGEACKKTGGEVSTGSTLKLPQLPRREQRRNDITTFSGFKLVEQEFSL